MFKARTLVVLVVAATGLATAAWLPTRSDTADASERSRKHRTQAERREPSRMPVGELTWHDEFDAPAGAPVDPTRWRLDTGGHGWDHQELQYYTGGTDNAAHDGAGNLAITARRDESSGHQCHYGTCRYTSARLTTAGLFAQRYGRMEARLKAPHGRGLWPAFWMLGDDIDHVGWPEAGEIDVMESIGQRTERLHGGVEGPGYSGRAALARRFDLDRPLSRGFHTYAVDWSPNRLVWYVDGVEFHRVTPESLDGDRWVFDHPFSLLLSLAVGGEWPGAPDRVRFPQRMLVDYVRVWAYGRDRTGEPSPAPPPSTAPTTAPTTAPPPTTKPTPPPATTPPTAKPPTTPPTTKPPAAKKWAPFTAYTAGQRVTYDGVTYQVREAHTSLPGWEPPALPALFQPV